ncbi:MULTISPECIES: tRNA pseudouridine(38-40) synthase TruA [Clostridia]|mgnify:FL=1|jgi:tRNA pseudouridine38-40 synthase|uniref:tRNA pseudouridine(38-40) synthase TruA n=1 Tax=Clostridia TaxID=186801 RepID=UPI000820383C|nr:MULTISPECIES: tRNA pseudouridine(38-40) synthase TruA [Clostridia]SCI07302.1 tRNA pseudouridine synthase A [uncultured Coprococcus sp.]MCB5504339.1 tRNA pseudouridine(38-40) synthase TruA [Coprococcus eutactus]MCU6731290.1 tRNA pseudouridine(38-40) synthase TruA [Coprococcus ammoniilyticus]NSC96150.1 tRNA pseudouridine(38-40) synthase TruA [Coprococcus eutactus]NSD35282.1 tRNA pseudouridine(38-40) synthase TruA [Coprococcus eutactus]
MKRVKLVVAYDGTNYHGWQVQDNGITIEEVLNRTISELVQEDIKVIGASRTDAGVHACGNVAVFDTESRIPGDKFSFALNQRLPEDIRIQESCEVDADFHPRYADTVKTYEYNILNRRFELPTKRLYAAFCYYPMDIERMNQAAAYLVGEHDFKSFCSAGAQVQTTVRTIYAVNVTKADDMVHIRITGNGFLYNMVRIIAGTLMQVGTGLMEPEQVKEILEARDRSKAGPTAVAKGLTLVEIRYE